MLEYENVEARGLDPEEFAGLTPRFKEMWDYLTAKAPPGQLPKRSDFDPVDFPKLLRFINLASVDRSGPGLRFRFDLVGTEQTHVSGREVTGLFVEEAVVPGAVELVNRNLKLAMESRRPVYSRFSMPQPEREFIDSERVYYPLAENRVDVDRFLILYHYFGRK